MAKKKSQQFLLTHSLTQSLPLPHSLTHYLRNKVQLLHCYCFLCRDESSAMMSLRALVRGAVSATRLASRTSGQQVLAIRNTMVVQTCAVRALSTSPSILSNKRAKDEARLRQYTRATASAGKDADADTSDDDDHWEGMVAAHEGVEDENAEEEVWMEPTDDDTFDTVPPEESERLRAALELSEEQLAEYFDNNPNANLLDYDGKPSPLFDGQVRVVEASQKDSFDQPGGDLFTSMDEMKLYDFRHLKLSDIKKHAEELSARMTPFPKDTSEYCVEYETRNYYHAGSTATHIPAARKVVLTVPMSKLKLSEAERSIFLTLVGKRYNEKIDVLKLVGRRFPTREMNYKYVEDLLSTLVKESKREAAEEAASATS
eukprot:m.361202 g.361202  ORF g.361202 m.361202 type:complete len:373 (+) comp19409_c0_seq1:45-1163(+)